MEPTLSLMPADVRDNTALSRFELDAGGVIVLMNYRLADGVMTLDHTETPPQARGRGLASRLTATVLEIARARGLKVMPRCPFVRAYLAKHPEFRDLLA
jgi:predicted GNAT family acetyltransferase